jgi:transcriptional regulator with XRE-family HTH domain
VTFETPEGVRQRPLLTRLRSVRESRWLSQAELGERAGIGRAAINRIERLHMRPRFKTVRALAEALDVEPDDLIDDC